MTTVLPCRGAPAPPGAGSIAPPPAAVALEAVAREAVAREAGRLAAALLAPVGATDPTTAPAATGTAGPADVRVGVDLVAVADVAASVEAFGDRYVHRIFTPHEVACCRVPDPGGPESSPSGGTTPAYAVDSLAARFAAKEAALKVLRPEGPRPEWRTIEVHRAGAGWCGLRLTGAAAVLAERAGIGQLALSMTHEAGVAAAVVVAVATPPDGPSPGPPPGRTRPAAGQSMTDFTGES